MVVAKAGGQDMLDERLSYFLMLLQMPIGVVHQFGRTVKLESLTQVIQDVADIPVVQRLPPERFEEQRIGARVSGLEVGAKLPEQLRMKAKSE